MDFVIETREWACVNSWELNGMFDGIHRNQVMGMEC